MGFPRCCLFISALLSTSILRCINAFVTPQNNHGIPPVETSVDYLVSTETDVLDATISKESVMWQGEDTKNNINVWRKPVNGKKQKLPKLPFALSVTDLAQRLEGGNRVDNDPSLVEFVASEDYTLDVPDDLAMPDDDGHYPFAAMLQGSAPYIASHLGGTAVFYIPGEWLHKPHQLFDSFLQDVSLARLMGMKIVLVADCRLAQDPTCPKDQYGYAHECHNTMRPTPAFAMQAMEEEAGYVRFEVERKLNRFLKKHLIYDKDDEEGNVVGGNMFYSARAFGMVPGSDEDFQHTGFVHKVYTDNIQKALDNNDVVLLTTVGCSTLGDPVNVNGHHLAASVAASLKAYKLIFMANEGSVLAKKNSNGQFFQEIPLSFAQVLCDYHKVKVHKTGFANFEHARQRLEPRAVELLLNLAWGSWAMDQGVTRAHIVNPKDGALLEELFTSKNGANTCLYHDEENSTDDDDGNNWLNGDDADDLNAFFAEEASQQGVGTRY